MVTTTLSTLKGLGIAMATNQVLTKNQLTLIKAGFETVIDDWVVMNRPKK